MNGPSGNAADAPAIAVNKWVVVFTVMFASLY
jgi:hypothetical protein